VTRRYAIGGLFAATLFVALAYASAFLPGGAPWWAAWAMLFGMAGSMVAAMAMGAARDGRVGRLAFPLILVFGLLVGGFGAVLLIPGVDAPDVVLWLGLPPRAALVIYGVGLLPLLLVPLAYALTFDDQGLDAAAIERIRAARTAAADPRP
jgi:hypothetical protein